ncbi:M1 family metallopeptidase [Paractinoplanes deccanensis]|nr:M1 family metallopeptidase [Actinoplanes deccanensis]
MRSLLAMTLAFTPGAPGIGDPYFPDDGNGGYDVRHYDLAVGYQPGPGLLTGVATVTAAATQDLSAFDLDLDGLTVRSVDVNGARAAWTRQGGELVVTPARGLPSGSPFTVVVRYDGVPEPIDDPAIGVSGFLRTADGFTVAGEPHAAATWFPVNDHPADKASYTFHVTVPEGTQAVANGRSLGSTTSGGRTTWNWDAAEPMASYLATVTAGRLAMTTYQRDGITFTDAIDGNADRPKWSPRTGGRLLYSGPLTGDTFYRRLTRTVSVPAAGGELSFWANLDTSDTSYLFVEARTAGQDDWTTLPDREGYMRRWAGHLCDGTWPFLAHYVTRQADGSCGPTGTTGEWWADSSYNFGPDDSVQLAFDLAEYAGKDIEISVTYAGQPPAEGEDETRRLGVFLDDLTVPGTATSFEDDGDTLDGWTATPAGASWVSTAAADVPTAGYLIKSSLARQPEYLRFFAKYFGPYPFREAGGIVTAADFGFALETQTRPTYSAGILYSQDFADAIVQHELAHQWFGNNVSLRRWNDIWLNEGFATYAPWLWSEKHGGHSAQETFDSLYGAFAPDDAFWNWPLTDPGPDHATLATDQRGAMVLQVLRNRVGDATFFRILTAWGAKYRGGNATSADFETLAERVSGRDLTALFDAWLHQPGRPTIVR